MKENECPICSRETDHDELEWNDGMCEACFESALDDPPIWEYYHDYNWNKK